MRSIQKVSGNFVRLFNTLLILLPTFEILIWVFKDKIHKLPLIGAEEGFSLGRYNNSSDMATIKWTAMTKFIGFTGSMIGLLPIILGLIILKLLFKNYQSNMIFTVKNVQYYKKLGYLFFLHSLVTIPLSDTIVILASTLNNPPGQRILEIRFGTPNFIALFCGLLIIAISWIMNEGYKLKEEKQYII